MIVRMNNNIVVFTTYFIDMLTNDNADILVVANFAEKELVEITSFADKTGWMQHFVILYREWQVEGFQVGGDEPDAKGGSFLHIRDEIQEYTIRHPLQDIEYLSAQGISADLRTRNWIFLNNSNAQPFTGQFYGQCTSRGPGANDKHIKITVIFSVRMSQNQQFKFVIVQTYLNSPGFFAILSKQNTMNKQERFKRVLEYFLQHQPEAETELLYKDPYQLTVAVILSAQCTDKRVNIITPPFFQRFPDVDSLANSEPEAVFEMIRSCSYPNNKTKSLIGMAKALVNNYQGVLPSDLDELQKIPGIGRKTANVLASVIYDKPAIAVDTHVFRVSARIGLTTNARTPLQTEEQLVRHIPENLRSIAHHWLILHGRYICIARKPKCDGCGISDCCKYFLTKQKTTGC
jgi:endonuclease-3